MALEAILFDVDDGVATVTLNRPEALNALSNALRGELVDVLSAIAADDAIEVMILTGAGRAFTAGLDLKELGGETTTTATISDRAVSDAMLSQVPWQLHDRIGTRRLIVPYRQPTATG